MSTRIFRTATALAGVVLLAACGAKAQSQAATVQTTVASSAETATGATTTTVSGQGGQRRQQLQAWRDCLSQHGVTLPSIAPGQNGQGGANPPTQPATGQPPASDAAGAAGAGGPPPSDNGAGQAPGGRGGFGGGAFTSILADPANKTAVDACASLQPQGGPGGAAGTGNGQRGQAFQAYLSCLKDNGVDVPTTVAGGPPASIDRTTPAYAEANTKCQVLLPQRQGGTDTSTTSATSTTTTVAG